MPDAVDDSVIFAAAADQRRQIADLIDSLDEAQLGAVAVRGLGCQNRRYPSGERFRRQLLAVHAYRGSPAGLKCPSP